MRDLAFAGVWVMLLPTMFVSPFVATLLWVWVALIAPAELLFGFMSSVPLNKVVAIPTLAMLFISKESKDFYADRTIVLLVLFAIAATLSLVTGLVPIDQGMDLYSKIIKAIILAFVITAVVTTRLRLHMLAMVLSLSFGFLAVKEGLISLFTGGGHKIIGSLSVGDNNSLATAILMTIPFMYYLAKYSAVKAVRVVMLVVIGLSVVTTIMTYSRGGFIGLAILGVFLVMNSRNKLPAVAMVVMVAVLILAFAPASLFNRLDTIQAADSDSSFMGRVIAWKLSWLIAMSHPLFGGGMHAVQQWGIWSAFTPQFHSLDFIPTLEPDVSPHAAHSIYFETLGDLGFVGFSLFVSLIGVTIWNCRKVRSLAKGVPSLVWAVDLARMMQVSIMIYAITAALLSMAYFEFFYVLVAMSSRCLRTTVLAKAALQNEGAAVEVRGRRRQGWAGQTAAARISRTA